MSARCLSADEVRALLPHRGHALFVQDAEVDGWAVSGHAAWEAAHPHLQGHFPGLPVVPGVYLLEAAAQLAGLAIRCAAAGADEGALGVLASVRRAGFHRFVRAGQRVAYRLQVQAVAASGMFIVAGGASVDGEKVLTVELTLANAQAHILKEAA